MQDWQDPERQRSESWDFFLMLGWGEMRQRVITERSELTRRPWEMPD